MERQEPSSAIPVVRHLAAAALVAVLGGGFTTQAVAQEAPELEAGMRVRVSATGCPQCFVVGRISGSSIFFGPGITDLPVHQATVEGAFRLAFPLVAHY